MKKLQLLSVKGWSVYAPDLDIFKNNKLDTSSIPANLKRRCSHASKMALGVANQVMMSNEIDYVIFGSQHGEISCTIELLKDICNKTILSPLNFSQSVLVNTAAGLFSVIASPASRYDKYCRRG